MTHLITYASSFAFMSIGYDSTLYISDYILKLCSDKYKSLSYSNKQYVTTNLNKSVVMLYIFYSFNKVFRGQRFYTNIHKG